MEEKFRTKSAVMVMLIRKNNKGEEEILLQKRQNTGYKDGYWDFSASGHVEKNESMKQAVVREAKEELNVDIELKNVHFITMIHKYSDDDIYYNGFFKVTNWNNNPIVNEPEKCSEIKWFKLDSIPEKTIEDRIDAINNYKKNIPYSEIGWEYIDI